MSKIVMFFLVWGAALGLGAQVPPEVTAFMDNSLVKSLNLEMTQGGGRYTLTSKTLNLTGELKKNPESGAWLGILSLGKKGGLDLGAWLPGFETSRLESGFVVLALAKQKVKPEFLPGDPGQGPQSLVQVKGTLALEPGLTLGGTFGVGGHDLPGWVGQALGIRSFLLWGTLAQGKSGPGTRVLLGVPGTWTLPGIQSLPAGIRQDYDLSLKKSVFEVNYGTEGLGLRGTTEGTLKVAGVSAGFQGTLTYGVKDDRKFLTYDFQAAGVSQGLPGLPGFSLKSLGVQGQVQETAEGTSGDFGFTLGLLGPKGLEARGAVVLEKAGGTPGASLVVGVDQLDLNGLTGKSLGLPTLPQTVLILSSQPRGTVKGSSLPAAAQEILQRAQWPLDADLSLNQGLALFTTLIPAKASGTLGKLGDYGFKGTYFLAGSFGLDAQKRPKLELAAGLDSLPSLPRPLDSFKFEKAQIFLGLGADAAGTPVFSAGLRGQVNLSLPTPVKLQGQLALNLGGSAGASGRFSGILAEDWKEAFGLQEVTFLKNTGLGLAIEAAGAGTVVLDGRTEIGGLGYGLGGGVSLLFSTGIPALKGLALRFSADLLDFLIPVRIGQVALKNLVRLPLTSLGPWKTKLTQLSQMDLPALTQALLPKSGPLAEMTAFQLKDAEFWLATPGMDLLPGFNDAGVKIQGTLLRRGQTLGKLNGGVLASQGLWLAGSLADTPFGPVTLKNPSLDLALGAGVNSRFFFKGAAQIKDLELAAVDLGITASRLGLKTQIDLGALGAQAALEGEISGPTGVSLAGSATLNPPKIGGVNLPSMTAEFYYDDGKLGFRVGGTTKWEKAAFEFSGWYKKPSQWQLTGRAPVDDGTKKFEIGDVEVAKLQVKKAGGIFLKLTPDRAQIHAKGEAKFTALSFTGFKGFTADWDFDMDLDADLKIEKTFKVFNPLKLKEENLKITYRIFP